MNQYDQLCELYLQCRRSLLSLYECLILAKANFDRNIRLIRILNRCRRVVVLSENIQPCRSKSIRENIKLVVKLHNIIDVLYTKGSAIVNELISE